MSKKWEKLLSETFVSNNINLSEEEAKQKVIEAQFQIKGLVQDKEEDKELSAAKEIVKDLSAGYNAALANEKAKIEFLLEVIEKRRALTK